MATALHPEAKPAETAPLRRLVLACGNTLRGDDGVAWHITNELERTPSRTSDEIVFAHQLLPEHAEHLSQADIVVFVDCSALTNAGCISSFSVEPAQQLPRVLTHHLDPASLLRLALDLYGKIPLRTTVITVGGESFGLTEELSPSVRKSVPDAVIAVRQALS